MNNQTQVVLSIVFKHGKGEDEGRREVITMSYPEFFKIYDNDELWDRLEERYDYSLTFVYPASQTKAEDVINCYLK